MDLPFHFSSKYSANFIIVMERICDNVTIDNDIHRWQVIVTAHDLLPSSNGIFAKIGRLASEEVFLQLVRQKCIPILLYGLDVCSLSKRNIQSLDIAVNRVLIKLFKTSNIDIIIDCRDMFDIKLLSVQLSQCFDAFIAK